MDLEALNREYAIPGILSLVRDTAGFVLIRVENELSSATLSTYGGQVLAWRPHRCAEDLLFSGECAHHAMGQEIKSGIPVCWPWFGRDEEHLDQGIHGFVRLLPWHIHSCAQLPDGSTRVRMALTDSAATRALWPHSFALELEIRIGSTLQITLTTRNTDTRPLHLTQGLHAYLKVADSRQIAVTGLEECRYLDKSRGAPDGLFTQQGPVTIDREVNRIYLDVPADLALTDPLLNRRIHIHSRHSRTCVVWNPWTEVIRSMDDLCPGDDQRFVCVETVNTASEVVHLAPQEHCQLGAEYRIESLNGTAP